MARNQPSNDPLNDSEQGDAVETGYSDSSEELPRLRRREPMVAGYVEQVAPQEPTESAEGELQNFECMDGKVRLTMLAGGKKLSLMLVDPENVHIRGTGTATLDLTCGPQNPVPVKIEYVPEPDAKLGTAGVIKAIIFTGKPAL
ncbi:MAG: hypothetical protein EXQ56_10165 [Acidobacteria bacterium]|nr:hypothetical protein [Acidobacteriota bacterium]